VLVRALCMFVTMLAHWRIRATAFGATAFGKDLQIRSPQEGARQVGMARAIDD